jgi:hypothetical protein
VSGDIGLVRRLVSTESRVAVRAKNPAVTELRRQLCQEGHHGTVNLGLVEVLVRRPICLGVLELDTSEELHCLDRPTPKHLLSE